MFVFTPAKKTALLLIFLCGFAVPLSAETSSNPLDTPSIEKQARTDAQRDSDEKFWALATFAGSTFFGPYIGIPALGAAVFYQPPPPAHRFLGKSPEYVQIYTHTYKSTYRRTAIRGTLIGCLGGGALYYLNRSGYGFSFVRTW